MAAREEKTANSREVLWNLSVLALIVALMAIGIAYGVDTLTRNTGDTEQSATASTLVPVNVAGVALSVPDSLLRFSNRPDADFSDRLDLVVALDLGGPAPVSASLTLLPRARTQASAILLDTVYLKHFSSKEIHGVPGLVGKPLTGGDGYDGETVWYDPIRADPFVAKCAPPLGDATEGTCIRTLVLDSGLSAILGFPQSALISWRQFDAPLLDILNRIGAGTVLR